MPSPRIVLRTLPLLLLPLFFTCSAQDAARPTVPEEGAGAAATQQNQNGQSRFVSLPPVPPLPQGWTILECGYTNQKQARVNFRGGYVGIDVALLIVEDHSLDRNRTFTLTEAETRVEAAIQTSAGDLVFLHNRPGHLIMSYNRCGLNFRPPHGEELAIWRYRPDTGWENLGGAHNRVNQTIEVQVNALSRFAVGVGRSE